MTHSDKNHPTKSFLQAQRKSVMWRVHFWAALIASPFALIATLTGLLYVFTPQIEARLYDHLDHVSPAGVALPLDQAVAVARQAAPAGWVLHAVLPAHEAHDTVKISFTPAASAGNAEHNHGASPAPAKPARAGFGSPAQAVLVYVNPYTAQVLGSLANQDRFGNWAKKLHSRLLQGDGWRWMIELAASWLMVMLLTGLFLWWPRVVEKDTLPSKSKGRIAWKQWHSWTGVALAGLSLVMLATGLTWSLYAGGQIKSLRDTVGQAPPRIPQHLRSAPHENALPTMSWQAAWEAVRQKAPDVAFQLTPPRGKDGTWQASAVDRSQPRKRFDLVLDARTGQSLYYSGWREQTWFSKATAIGIPFHRGEFGWWNQLCLLIFGVGLLFSLVSGWVMFFKRRRSGLLGLPRVLPGAWKAMPVGVWVLAGALCVGMPLLAVSGAVLLLLEIGMHRFSRNQTPAPGL